MTDKVTSPKNALIINLNEHFQLDKKAQIKNRHIQLLKLADGVIFRKGYSDFRLDMLCELSGCSRGTIYKSFKTKDALLEELAKEVFSLWLYLSKKVLESDISERNKLRGILVAKKICKCLFPTGVNSIYFNVVKHQLDRDIGVDTPIFKQEETFFIEQIEELFNRATELGEFTPAKSGVSLTTHFVWKSIYLDETIIYKMMGKDLISIEDINIDLFTSFLDLIGFQAGSTVRKDLSVNEFISRFFEYEKGLIKNKV